MTAEDQNFIMYPGDNKIIRVTVDDGVLPTAAVVDLSGVTEATWVLARRPGKPALVTKKLSLAEIAIPTPANGIIEVTLVPDDTKSLSPGNYYHELDVIDTGIRSTVTSGKQLSIRSSSNKPT